MSKSLQARILVVDDEPKLHDRLVKELELDFNLFSASGGFECLRLIKSVQPDVILLDVHMIGLSGHEVCMRLKAEPFSRRIPVVLMSGLSREEDIEAAFKSGADYFLAKPFSYQELINKLLIVLAVNPPTINK